MKNQKRSDPDFESVSGYIPSAIAQQFKNRCREKKISFNTGIEHALNSFVLVEKFIKTLEQGERPDVGLISEIAHDLKINANTLVAFCDSILLHRKNGEIEHERNGN